ncbi:MAG: efflux RND transporter periplasmic adaptor subunit [Acidobacteria bacterium]|nr:efflux RND transporter periplasmic adaptor subunit [Acidobacteriota bacterium]
MRIPETLLRLAVLALTGIAVSCAEVETGEPHSPAAFTLGNNEDTPMKGPSGGRLLTEGDFQLEVTIYERGVPPEFRVYAFEAGRPIPLSEVQVTIELHRLGNRVDVFAFQPENDYLHGDKVVEEPHSFDVLVIAKWKGNAYRLKYSQVEGRTELGPEAVRRAGIVVEEAGSVQMRRVFELPGEIALDPDKVAHIVPRFSGVITEVRKSLGDQVSKDEVIAVVDSRELAASKLGYIQAIRKREFARISFEREERLWKKRISAEEEYLAAQQLLQETTLTLDGSAQNLRALGLRAAEIKHLAERHEANLARYEIRAPSAGTVIEKHVALGEAVKEDADLFTIADLSTVLAKVTVYGKDLRYVRVGQEVRVQSDILGLEVPGTVAYMGPLLGAETRTATAHVVLGNPDGNWRPGVFVTVHLTREEFTAPVAVRLEAIQTFRDWDVVFFQHGNLFEARPLELGRRDEEWVEVLAGLSAGERYVAKNSFVIKADVLKSGATHDH